MKYVLSLNSGEFYAGVSDLVVGLHSSDISIIMNASHICTFNHGHGAAKITYQAIKVVCYEDNLEAGEMDNQRVCKFFGRIQPLSLT